MSKPTGTNRTDPTDERYEVLIVDDDASYLELASTLLEWESEQLRVRTETDPNVGFDIIRSDAVDCVVIDYDMRRSDGLEFLDRVRTERPDLPFILHTEKGDADIVDAADEHGATDYLQKADHDTYAELADRIVSVIEHSRQPHADHPAESFETVIDTLPGLVYQRTFDSNWQMTQLRGDCERLCGYTPDALRGDEIVWDRDLVHPDDQADVHEARTSALASGESFEMSYRIVTNDGEPKQVWEQGHPRTVEGDHPTMVEGFITHFTPHGTPLEEDVDGRPSLVNPPVRPNSMSILDTVLDRVTDVVYSLDTDWRVTYINEGGRVAISSNVDELLTKDEILGENLWELVPTLRDGQLYLACSRSLDRQEFVNYEVYHPEGNEGDGLWAETDVFPSETGVTVISREITERKENERDLDRQRKLLDEFAGVVSHDLRNPVQVASGRLGLAQAECDSEHLDEISTSLGRMETLIDDLLTLSRAGEKIDELAPVEVSELAEASWQTVDTFEATLYVDTDQLIRADRGRCRQLLENLIRNAIEHTEDDVSVTVGGIEGGFYVEDDGPGISPDARTDVFKAGYTTSEDGTGLGLRIVRDIVEAHGWDVHLTEGLSKGTRFEFTNVDVLER